MVGSIGGGQSYKIQIGKNRESTVDAKKVDISQIQDAKKTDSDDNVIHLKGDDNNQISNATINYTLNQQHNTLIITDGTDAYEVDLTNPETLAFFNNRRKNTGDKLIHYQFSEKAVEALKPEAPQEKTPAASQAASEPSQTAPVKSAPAEQAPKKPATLKPTLDTPKTKRTAAPTKIKMPTFSEPFHRPKMPPRTKVFDYYQINSRNQSRDQIEDISNSKILNPTLQTPEGAKPMAEIVQRALDDFTWSRMRAGEQLDGPAQMYLAVEALSKAGVDLNDKAVLNTLGMMFIEDYVQNLDDYQGNRDNRPGEIYSIHLNPVKNTVSLNMFGADKPLMIAKPEGFEGMDNHYRGHQVDTLLGRADERLTTQDGTKIHNHLNVHIAGGSDYIAHHAKDELGNFLELNPKVPKDSSQWNREQIDKYSDHLRGVSAAYLDKATELKYEHSVVNIIQSQINDRGGQVSADELTEMVIEQVFKFKDQYEAKAYGPPNKSSLKPELRHLLTPEDEAVVIKTLSQFGVAVNIQSPEEIKTALDRRQPIPASAFVAR